MSAKGDGKEPLPGLMSVTMTVPVGVPLKSLENTVLLHEELESLRLADLERRYQVEAAGQMGVSRGGGPLALHRVRSQLGD